MSQQQSVEVDVRHLELIRATLNSSKYHSQVLDMAEQYRKMSVRPQDSPMTKALISALDIVEDYIIEAEEEEDGQPEAPSESIS